MKNVARLRERSSVVLQENMRWLLYSDIRIKRGENKGALYGWKQLNPPSFPFIYSEITGYAVSCFTWMAAEFGNLDALKAAKSAYSWIAKNSSSGLVVAKPPGGSNQKNELSDVYYSFDNGMIIAGLLNLQKITNDKSIIKLAEKMTRSLIEHFFDGEKLIPRVDSSFEPMKEDILDGIVKWSTIHGAYHCKFSLGLLELSQITGNNEYARVSDSLCEYSKKSQKGNGEFVTNPDSDTVYLHPHLYACEGLIYSGIKQSNASHYAAGLKGIKWAMDQVDLNGDEGLFRNTGPQSVEQSDCTAQLLRLLILCQSDLENTVKKSELTKKIDRLHRRLLEFYIPSGEGRGAMKYQFSKDTACSWCTMFSMQALRLLSSKSKELRWIDYFV